MIFYFTGTGNSQWVAEEIAKRTDDNVINIMKESSQNIDIEGKVIGFVFPVYAWDAPEPIYDFIKKLKGKPAFSFAVATCGSEVGNALTKLNKIFKLNSQYSLIMPSNYIIASDVESKEIIGEKIANAEKTIAKISVQINNKEAVTEVHTGSAAAFKSGFINYFFNKYGRMTKPFRANDKCTSCGLCERICPAKTINCQGGKPVWGKKCYQCLACLNYCPTQAIQYGKGTEKKGRYYFSKYYNK